MNINYPFLSFGWLGGALLGTTGAGGYLIYDSKNPTGSQRLLGRGYIFNPPKLTSDNNSKEKCFENLFKEISELDESRLYACGVASIDIYNNVGQFPTKNTIISFLFFYSEIYMRKGGEGWKISTTFDNLVGSAQYKHSVQTYKRSNNTFQDSNDKIWAIIEEFPTKTVGKEDDTSPGILLGNKNLNIKVPEGSWYEGTNYFVENDSNFDFNKYGGQAAKSFKNSKSWSGVWIQDNRSSSSWIFQNIEIFIEDKKYSQVFCKSDNLSDDNCRQKRKCEDEIWIGDEKKVQQMIQQISTSKGKWIDTERFCKKSSSRNLQDQELKDLELFCFSKQN